jgi:hypothetical protein
MDASGGATGPAELRPAIMQSTPVDPPLGETETAGPFYVVHAPGAPVPDRAPACQPDCSICKERRS